MKTVTIVPNTQKDPSLECTKKAIEEISRYAEKIIISSDLGLDAYGIVEKREANHIFDATDAVIAVGGDGTILRLAPELSRLNIPILGVNLGRVGFMAEIEPDEISLIEKLFSSEYIIDSRMMLDVEVFRNDNKVCSYSCLNDAVIMNGSVSKMIELELSCNHAYVTTYHADGLILSTPTGSTAYSLSAGGTVIDPVLECILVTPVCAHSFHNARPMVFSSNAEFTVKDVAKRDDDIYLTLDGNFNVHVLKNDIIKIKKSQFTTDLI